MSRYTLPIQSLPALLVLAIVSAVVTIVAQGPAKTAADLATLGPRIGQRVPDFRLADQSGTVRDLKSVLKRGGAMLVFFRSAEW